MKNIMKSNYRYIVKALMAMAGRRDGARRPLRLQ